MAQVGIKELLEAGVHFGHQTRRWNPKMRRFIFGERAGIHIIDLQQTERLLVQAQEFAAGLAARGGTVMFVGTKKQARDSVREAAEAAGMPFVNQRWLGGLLTNFHTISNRIKRLHDLTDWTENGTLELLPTRERISAIAEREKLETNLGGVRDMQRPPDAIFIVDLKTEVIAVREAVRLRIPIIGLVDTNVDPGPVRYPIPGNDDAIRSCKVVIDAIAEVVGERYAQFRAEEERARREAEEQARREAEEKARREAEERERQEAEERARREAEAAAAQGGAQQPPAAAAGEAQSPRPQQAPGGPQQARPQQAQAGGRQQSRAQQRPAQRRQPDRPARQAAPAATNQAHGGAPSAGDPDPAPAAEGGQTAAQGQQSPAATAGGAAERAAAEASGEQPKREDVERAERDEKAPLGEAKRPRGAEEADAKAAEQREGATRPDQEVG